MKKKSYLVTVPCETPFPARVPEPLYQPLPCRGDGYVSAEWPILLNDTYVGIIEGKVWVDQPRTFQIGELVPEMIVRGAFFFHKKGSAKEREHAERMDMGPMARIKMASAERQSRAI